MRFFGALSKAGYPVACVLSALTLATSGVSYLVVRSIGSIGGSQAIISGPSTGPQNILLMGLESRRDWNGNILPESILKELHAGSRQGVADGVGGDTTNTLILIHLFAGGKRAVGFSIPRDDWVTFSDTVGPQQEGKIDQAYGLSMFYEEGNLRAKYPDMSQDRLAYLGNEAGRAAEVATVEKLTGVHIDHFAEVNLEGFYELANIFGGVEVCLNHAVYDANSGANFRAGYQHLNPAQALAFVRQRDGLPNGDLDRTHRQQAFIDSVLHQLRTEGVLDDLTKVQALLSVAKQYVITDDGWNLIDFWAQERGLNNQDIKFYTLPIVGYQMIDNQDANVVNIGYIKAIVKAAFSEQQVKHPHHASDARAVQSAATATVQVLNGGYTAGLAARVSAALVKIGYRAGGVGNTAYRTSTAVLYGKDAASGARQIAALFRVTAVASATLAPGHVQVLLGAASAVPEIAVQSSVVHPRPVAIPTNGPQGGAVVAKNGIPCVN